MKISELLKEYENNQYVIGGIFSNPILTSDNQILYSSFGKRQKTNSHLGHEESFKIFGETLKKINPKYNVISLSNYDGNKMEGYTINKATFGVVIEFENDLDMNEEKIINYIYNNSIVDDKTDFIRGVFDSSGSVDVSVKYIVRDILKKNGKYFPYYIADIINDYFDFSPLNFNERYNQPTENSQSKNSQYRISMEQFFTIVGTVRNYTIRVFNDNYEKRFDNNNWIKKGDAYYLDMSHLLKIRSNNKTNSKLINILKDFDAKEMFDNGIKNREYIRKALSSEWEKTTKKNNRNSIPINVQKELLEYYEYKDGLTKEILFRKNSTIEHGISNTIRDIHHIIPYSKREVFNINNTLDDDELKNISNDKRNLISLNPSTHISIHRSSHAEVKMKLEKLYKIVSPYLLEKNIKLSLENFIKLY